MDVDVLCKNSLSTDASKRIALTYIDLDSGIGTTDHCKSKTRGSTVCYLPTKEFVFAGMGSDPLTSAPQRKGKEERKNE